MAGPDTSPPQLEDGIRSWDFAALTDPGRVRANNEDAIAFDASLGLAILADGMGGYNGGEVASGMAIALLQASFGRWLAHAGPGAHVRAMRRALQAGTDEANSAILEAGIANMQLQGMGTTLVVAAFGPRRALVGHIGDSRCYRLREGKLEQLTRDHSLLQEQLDAGMITPEQAAQSPHRNLVTRALGIERAVDLEMHEHSAQVGDLYLLCSDGLSEMVTDAQISTVLLQNCDLPEKALLLVVLANDNGGRDNISIVLARAGAESTAAATA
ncbi:Stp1/IreP family PP2C-type Ser/Thr phosphatase [Variovorax guangxiensis]|uniref:Stp1/IreP family PP2C-type Ser/Thr phosphatase n=1 Tax=Variovorax guangxiensis TaxID=1775474 RepID=A0A502DWM2_9BURK|nr:Stp1/IreP family PP2C-type Ser/Thr phosphatase [Variovorax guangxiensis]TPG24816.1 Stp1/IreP family PP2C-type Ser/Thr phosphatase [Variovorax ginsengisoli]TPG29069.1 Stp1/IreP family PP2C-type Ser/Thr phosphatase [Variovorax guangxiensis]